MAEKNLFELLREKSILAILDGDVDFGEIETTEFKGEYKNLHAILERPRSLRYFQ
jgi:hypothetical protein